jgi:ribonucleoside-diphosphate reductase alpha chain
MQTDIYSQPSASSSAQTGTQQKASSASATAPGQIRVIKRNGAVVGYDESKVVVAITKAFLAVEGGTAAASSRVHETVTKLTASRSPHLRAACPLVAPSTSRTSRTRWNWR